MEGDTSQAFLLTKFHRSIYGHLNKFPQKPALGKNTQRPLVSFGNSASDESLLPQRKFPADLLLAKRHFMDIVTIFTHGSGCL